MNKADFLKLISKLTSRTPEILLTTAIIANEISKCEQLFIQNKTMKYVYC